MSLKNLLVIAFIAALALGKCANDKDSVKSENGLCECNWYKDDNCCPGGMNIDGSFDSVDVAGGNAPSFCIQDTNKNSGKNMICEDGDSKGCADRSILSYCGYLCSPDQSDFYETGNGYMCQKFADEWYDECKDAKMYDPIDRSCKKVSEVYANSTLFALAEGAFDGIRSDDCWNAASLAKPSALVAVPVLFGLLGGRNAMILTITFMVLASLTSAKCPGDIDSVSVDAMCRCSFYKEDNCCPGTYARVAPWQEFEPGTCTPQSKLEKKYACGKIGTECSDYFNFLNCADDCTPKRFEWTSNSTSALVVCSEMGDKIWDACKDEKMFDYSEFKCRKRGDIFPDATTWLTTIGFEYGGSSGCWNSASFVGLSVALIVAIVALF
jgi:hypothetical protein